MDFIVGVSRSRKLHDSIWINVHRMTKSTHFIPVKSTYRAEDYTKLYIDEIVRCHRIPLSITSHFWRSFQKSLGKQVKLSNTFSPPTDGQVEHTIHTLEDMLRACVIDFKGNWDDYLPLI